MIREEIKKQAEIYTDDVSNYTEWTDDGGWTDYNAAKFVEKAFIEGAKCADANPKSPWISVNDDLPCETVVVVSGTARGVDRLGEQYTRERGYPIERYPADWDRYGKSVGFRRNEQMVAVADGAVMFWNGESHGTRHDIELSRKKGIPHVIKMYKINKSE